MNSADGRVLVVVDGQNLWGQEPIRGGGRIEASAFVAWCRLFGRPTVKWFQGSYAGLDASHHHLRSAGIDVQRKRPKVLPGGARKADMDLELTLAVVDGEAAHDTVLLVTNDGDFAPLVARLRARGTTVKLLCTPSEAAGEMLRAVEPGEIYDLRDEIRYFGFEMGSAA